MKNVITTRVSDDVLAMIDRLAASRDRSRAWIVNKLVDEAAKRHIEFDDFVQVGLDDLAAGRVHTQEEMEKWFESRKARRASRIAAE